MNENPTPIKSMILRKNEQIKEEIIRETIFKSNTHLNGWKFQMHWSKLKWVDKTKLIRIHSVLRLKSSTLKMENRHVILLDTKIETNRLCLVLQDSRVNSFYNRNYSFQ